MLLSTDVFRWALLDVNGTPSLQSKCRKFYCSIACILTHFYPELFDQVNDELCKENLQLAGELLNSFHCDDAMRWLAAS